MPKPLARVALVLTAAATGCTGLLGLPDYSGTGGAGTAGSGGAGHGTTSTVGTGGKGATGTSTVGTGAASSTATGGGPSCVEGKPCYTGLDGTEGVGACMGGTTTCEGGVPICNDVPPSVQLCSGQDANCDGLTGCTGAPRWEQSGFKATSTTVAAAQDGTVALAGVSTQDVGFFVATFDARGRPCWAGPTVFNGGSSALEPIGVAFTGTKTTPGGHMAQIICGDAAGTPLAADTIVVGTGTGPVAFVQGKMQQGAGMGDAWIARLDPTGKVVWGELFGSDKDDQANAVAADENGNVYVTGSVGDPMTVLPCTGGADAGVPSAAGVFVAQIHPDGTCGWFKGFPGPARGTGIAVDGSGNVAVTGSFLSMGTLDVDGQTLQGVPGLAGFAIKLLPDGTVNGAPLGIGCQVGRVFVAISHDGGTYAMCQTPGTGEACTPNANMDPVVTITNVEQKTWSCYVSATGPAFPEGLASDAADNLIALVASGGTVSSPDWGANVIAPGGLVAFKLPGPYNVAPVWGYAYGAGTTFSGYGLAVDGMGDVAIGATPMSPVSIGGLPLAGGGAAVFELAP